MTKRSFPPLIDEKSRVLILGSLPGAESLRAGQYYAYKHNHFWRIISDILGYDNEPEDYSEKCRMLLDCGLALWDVAESAEREGSLDSRIRNLKPNDIPGLLKSWTGLRYIIFNGGFAFSVYKKCFGNPSLPYEKVLSTSPACAGRFDEKLDMWRKAVKSGLEDASPFLPYTHPCQKSLDVNMSDRSRNK